MIKEWRSLAALARRLADAVTSDKDRARLLEVAEEFESMIRAEQSRRLAAKADPKTLH
jgi:predicted phage-related endonuclease